MGEDKEAEYMEKRNGTVMAGTVTSRRRGKPDVDEAGRSTAGEGEQSPQGVRRRRESEEGKDPCKGAP